MVMRDTDRTPWDAGTFGSRTMPTMGPQLRAAAACAREALIDLAAARWNVVRTTLSAEAGATADAFECGPVINPNGLRNQVEGAIVQGIGGALFEAICFENGRITNPHFAQYRVPRLPKPRRSRSSASTGKTCRRPARARPPSSASLPPSPWPSSARPANACERCRSSPRSDSLSPGEGRGSRRPTSSPFRQGPRRTCRRPR